MADLQNPPPAGAIAIDPPPPAGAIAIQHHGDDFISHAASSTWDNVKGAFNLATGADLWNKAIDSARAGNYGEAAKAFQGIVDGPAARIGNGLLDTASVAAGHMKDAASKLIHGDAEGASDSAKAAGLHMATVLAPHAEQAAENFKQGNYGAVAGDLTGDALAYLAAKGIHIAPETASAAGDAVGSANMKQAAGALPPPTLAEGAVALSGHPHVAAGMYAKRAIPKVWDAIRKPAPEPEPEPEPEPFVPPGTMTSTAPTAYVGRPVVPNAETPTPANYYTQSGTSGVASPEPAAAAAADPVSVLRDGFAQGYKFKDFASITDPAVAATVQRLAEMQAARDARAAAPAAAPAAAIPELKVQNGHANLKPAAEPAAAPEAQPTVPRRLPGMNYQDVDAYLASKRPPQPPGEPGEAAAPAATPPPPAAPAAPAAALPDNPRGGDFFRDSTALRSRADIANNMADYFHKGGMKLADLESRKPAAGETSAAWDLMWKNAAKQSGSKRGASYVPSQATMDATMDRIEALEKSKASEDLENKLVQSLLDARARSTARMNVADLMGK